MFCVQKECSLNTYGRRDGLKNFDGEFYRLKMRHSRPAVRATEIDTDKIKVLVDENPYFTARDIAGDFQISNKSVLYHIRRID